MNFIVNPAHRKSLIVTAVLAACSQGEWVRAQTSPTDPGRYRPAVNVQQAEPAPRVAFDTAYAANAQVGQLVLSVSSGTAPADSVSPVKVTVTVLDRRGEPLRGSVLLTLENSGGRLQLPGAGTDEFGPGRLDADRNVPGTQMKVENGSATFTLLAPAAPQDVKLRVAAEPTLNAPAERITDVAIHADYKGFEAQQASIKALNDTGRHRVASYSLAKAQCWLDVSFHEYTRNDRSAFPELALQESKKITTYLEAGGAVDGPDNPAWLTPLVNKAARLREDLWAMADATRTSPGKFCAAQLAACGEVELVHAGNEFNQQGWRHAKPYIQIAEDKIGDAQTAAMQCPGPAASAPAPAPQPARPMPAPAAPVEVELSANVLFNFDRSDVPNIRPMTRQKLDELIETLASGKVKAGAITLTGHADRSNYTGQGSYNQRLSLARANTIKAYLQDHGVDTSRTTVRALADSVEVAPCRDSKLSRAEFEECLLPNRRVEIMVTGVKGAKTTP